MSVEAEALTKHEVLRRYWGYDDFRPSQAEIIDSVLAGHDTLGLLPTGGGKSITFQVPALMLPGLTVVVTPLISLMKDQVDNLASRGIRAALFHSGMTQRERELGMTRCRLGKAKIAYVSPERLQNETFLAELRGLRVSLLVVDEAHCISQWGYDFRPSYLRIRPLRRIIGEQVPVLALTASATPEVTADIMERLGFRAPLIHSRSFTRRNLSYIVRLADNKDEMLLKVLRATSGSSIVYVRSRKRTRELAELISRAGISALAYHAGLDPEEKDLRQDMWKSDRCRVMVATNAFGMGIDKPDVRLVVHYDLPSSLEEYYQEAGRGGRDGLESLAVVITNVRDKATLSRRVTESFPPKDFLGHVYEMAGNFLGVPVGEGYNRTFEFNTTQFCSVYNLPPVPTDSALRLLSRAGYLDYVDETTSRSRLMMLMKRDELYSLRLERRDEEVLQDVLRRYPGLFADYVYISETMLSRHLMLSTEEVYQSLLLLTRMHVLHYIPRTTTPYLHYPTSREEPRHLIIPLEVYERQRERMERRIEAIKEFAFGTGGCRAAALLRYFGETAADDCGKCDYCRDRRRAAREDADTERLEEAVLYKVAQHTEGLELLDLIAALRPVYSDTAIIAAVRTLADRHLLTLTSTRICVQKGLHRK